MDSGPCMPTRWPTKLLFVMHRAVMLQGSGSSIIHKYGQCLFVCFLAFKVVCDWSDGSVVRALTILEENQCLTPGTHKATHNYLNSSSREPSSLFQPLQALHACNTEAYLQAKHSLYRKYFFLKTDFSHV